MNDDELKRAALAGPAVEPLAHINSNGVVHAVGYPWEAGEVLTPLYASPPPPAEPESGVCQTCISLSRAVMLDQTGSA